MKRFSTFVLGFAVLLAAGAATAAEKSAPVLQIDERLTPGQRVIVNKEKVRLNPSLRGRWNPKSRTLASQTAFEPDRLADDAIRLFRTDEELSRLAVRVRARSERGVLTLEGFVNDEAERRLIARRLSSLSGVKELKNDLKIKSSNRDLLDE